MKRESKHLKYTFTQDEIRRMSYDLARGNRDLRSINEQKKEVVADFASRIKAQEGAVDRLSEQIANGYEYRLVTCEVFMDSPTPGLKTIARTDTGESWTEPMEPHERQGDLFEKRAPSEEPAKDADWIENPDDDEDGEPDPQRCLPEPKYEVQDDPPEEDAEPEDPSLDKLCRDCPKLGLKEGRGCAGFREDTGWPDCLRGNIAKAEAEEQAQIARDAAARKEITDTCNNFQQAMNRASFWKGTKPRKAFEAFQAAANKIETRTNTEALMVMGTEQMFFKALKDRVEAGSIGDQGFYLEEPSGDRPGGE